MCDTQQETVLAHLQSGETITSIQAIMEYGITRLAAVICELRKQGWCIDSVVEIGVNRAGRKVNYTRYILRGGGNDNA